MKRDFNLICKLLLRLEAVQDRPFTTWMILNGDNDIAVEGHTADEIGHALQLMVEAGLIRA